MQVAIVFGGESVAAGDGLYLLLAVPEQRNLGADGAAIGFCAFEVKLNPVVAWGDGVFVDQERAALVGDDGVKDAGVPKVGERDRAAIVEVCDADGLRDVFEFAC